MFALCTGVRWLYLWYDSEKWGTGTAIIEDVHVKTVTGLEERANTYFRVQARYRYRWHERMYSGNRLTISEQPFDYPTSEMWRKKLDAARQTGQGIPILVNPKDPSMSVLVREWESRYVIIGLVGFLFILTPNIAMVAFWIARRYASM